MKTLIVYYSRTGTTAKVTAVLKEKFAADMFEIKCARYGRGSKGYMQAGKDATKRKVVEIEKFNKNLDDYDLVLIGTPVWAWNLSAPVRTFCRQYKGTLKKAAFFCTMGGSGCKKAFVEMQKESGQEPIATLSLTAKEVVEDEYYDKLNEFINKLSN